MKTVRIPKGNGAYRLIYVPSLNEKLQLREWKDLLEEIQENICGPWVHGCMPGRSPVTNALAHVGREWTLSMDLKDFFDSVTRAHLARYLPPEAIAEIDDGGILHQGAPRQGLPTSPAAANIGAADLDNAIAEWLSSQDVGTVYTRYVDDLSFSWNGERSFAERLKQAIDDIVKAHGFTINKKKTRLQSARAGRRVICGVSVGATDIRPTREALRNLRAAERMWARTWTAKAAAARLLGLPVPSRDLVARKKLEGLREWCSLKTPKYYHAPSR